MGYSSWSDDAYKNLSTSYKSKSTDEIFENNKTRSASNEMLPKGIEFRESRDSEEHPQSLAIAVFLDVTGSMGMIAEKIARDKLGALMSTLISHGIEHPQVLFGAIGDHISDEYPLQVGQFESGTEELDKWLTSVFLEGCGGGQVKESYLLSWLFAARHTSIDCFEKRGEKGVLITMGDEASWSALDSSSLKEIMGYPEATELTDKQLLEEVQRMYNVYHIHIKEGYWGNNSEVLSYWKDMLGERVIELDDYTTVCEVIASIVAMLHGIELDRIANSFDNATAGKVKNALQHIDTTSISKQQNGVINL